MWKISEIGVKIMTVNYELRESEKFMWRYKNFGWSLLK